MTALIRGELIKVRTTRTAIGFALATIALVLLQVLISILASDLVSVQETGDLNGHLLASPRRARDQGRLGHIGRHGQADAAQHHDPFGDQVHQLVLLAEVLIEQQVQLVEGCTRNLPMMLLVEVAQHHRIGEHLVERAYARAPHVFAETDRHRIDGSKLLDDIILSVLPIAALRDSRQNHCMLSGQTICRPLHRREDWAPSTGPDRFRRGLYTYFWRATPHPSLVVFDALASVGLVPATA